MQPEIAGYEIERLLGRGGFASVHLATHATGDVVALKVLGAHASSDDDVRRFERERLSMSALKGHPHIVDVLDSGLTSEGLPWMALEFVGGGSLRDRLSAAGALHWSEVVTIGVEICAALDAAHRAGVLHRDIKPANILLDDDGAKLGDFGIARLIGVTNVTAAQSIVGTLAYTPPEVFHNRPFDGRSDLYQLGVTMYEALIGRAPFTSAAADNKATVIRRILDNPAPPVAQFDVPIELSDLLDTVLAKDPDDRPVSAQVLMKRLQDVEVRLGRAPSTPKAPAEAMQTAEPAVAATPAVAVDTDESVESATPDWPASAEVTSTTPSRLEPSDADHTQVDMRAERATTIFDRPESASTAAPSTPEPPADHRPTASAGLPELSTPAGNGRRTVAIIIGVIVLAALGVATFLIAGGEETTQPSGDSEAPTGTDPGDEPAAEASPPLVSITDSSLIDSSAPIGVSFGLVENSAGLTMVGATGAGMSTAEQRSVVWTHERGSGDEIARPSTFGQNFDVDGQRLWDIDVLESVTFLAVGEASTNGSDGVAWVGSSVGTMRPAESPELVGPGSQRLFAVSADPSNDGFIVVGQTADDGATVPGMWIVTEGETGWSEPSWTRVGGIGGGGAGLLRDVDVDGSIAVAVGRDGTASAPRGMILIRNGDVWAPLIGPIDDTVFWGVTITPNRIVAVGSRAGAPMAVVVDRQGAGVSFDLPTIDGVDGVAHGVTTFGNRVFAVGSVDGDGEDDGAIWELLPGDDLDDDTWTTRLATDLQRDGDQEFWGAAPLDDALWIVGAESDEDGERPAAMWRFDPSALE